MGAREGAMGARHRGEKPWWFTPARVLMRIWKSDIRRTLIVRGLHRYVASECRRLLWPDAGGCGVRRRVRRTQAGVAYAGGCGVGRPCGARLVELLNLVPVSRVAPLWSLLESPVPARAGTRRPRAHGAMVHTSAHAESSSLYPSPRALYPSPRASIRALEPSIRALESESSSLQVA